MDEVVARVVDIGSRLHIYAVLATLKYLALSGRVGKLVAGMADTLNIKPILTVQDGKLDLLEKVRTRKKAIERMDDLAGTAMDGKKIAKVGIIHANTLDGAKELQSQFCERFFYRGEVMVAEFTAGLSVHAGAGLVGLVILAS